MSAVPSGVSSSIAPGAKPMEVLVVGKIVRARRYQANKYFTAVVCPAADEYSKPAIVEIRSAARIGDPEQVIRQRCKVGGYEGRQYRATDKETGESRTAVPVNITLDAIE